MLEEKEAQLEQYFEISNAMLAALHQGAEDKVPGLLEQRQGCMLTIDKLDAEAGKVLMNKRIQEQLTTLATIDEEILKLLQQTLAKLSERVRFAQNDQYLKSRYDERTTVSKGVFYDRKR